MTARLPKKLSKSPLLETIFEMRFEPATSAAGDLLPGLLYSAMKDQYPEVIPLPMASVPRQLRDSNADLVYQPSHRLRGGPNAVQVGDRVVSLSSNDYPGWERFKGLVDALVEQIRTTGLVKAVERFSFRYINVLEARPGENQLSLLNARIELLNHPVLERGLQLRIERDDHGFVTIFQIAPNATASLSSGGKQVSGLLVDVDTLAKAPGADFFANRSDLLESGHTILKQNFFALLTEPALQRLDPVW